MRGVVRKDIDVRGYYWNRRMVRGERGVRRKIRKGEIKSRGSVSYEEAKRINKISW